MALWMTFTFSFGHDLVADESGWIPKAHVNTWYTTSPTYLYKLYMYTVI